MVSILDDFQDDIQQIHNPNYSFPICPIIMAFIGWKERIQLHISLED